MIIFNGAQNDVPILFKQPQHSGNNTISSYACSSANVFSVCGLPSYVFSSFFRLA